MIIFFLFLLGLLLGSFANVCIWRMPREESIVRPRSHCPSCGGFIPARLNVPVLSYLWLKGRCAFCRAKIPPRYPLVELLMGLLFAAQGARFAGDPVLAGLGLALSFSLVVLSFVDLDHQIIPDEFSLGLLVLGLLSSPWNASLGWDWAERLASSLVGAAAGFFLLLSIAWLGEKVFKKEAMGGGDIKLMAAVGALMGWRGVFTTLFLGSFSGTLAAGAMMLMRRLRRGDYLPFGPFLAAGAWAAWMWGEPLSDLFYLPFSGR
jgi:leader peptidase (prepilin peptidase) / N-methyltransferase